MSKEGKRIERDCTKHLQEVVRPGNELKTKIMTDEQFNRANAIRRTLSGHDGLKSLLKNLESMDKIRRLGLTGKGVEKKISAFIECNLSKNHSEIADEIRLITIDRLKDRISKLESEYNNL